MREELENGAVFESGMQGLKRVNCNAKAAIWEGDVLNSGRAIKCVS